MMQDEIIWILTVINLCLNILNNLILLLKKEKIISEL
ncbi:hypothetical protein GYMC52_2936 [Geobacillus sp. Y412MC52]|nr:hypothetical protein GYMC52_2936 [Geobacillus sp. Y412MC52]